MSYKIARIICFLAMSNFFGVQESDLVDPTLSAQSASSQVRAEKSVANPDPEESASSHENRTSDAEDEYIDPTKRIESKIDEWFLVGKGILTKKSPVKVIKLKQPTFERCAMYWPSATYSDRYTLKANILNGEKVEILVLRNGDIFAEMSDRKALKNLDNRPLCSGQQVFLTDGDEVYQLVFGREEVVNAEICNKTQLEVPSSDEMREYISGNKKYQITLVKVFDDRLDKVFKYLEQESTEEDAQENKMMEQILRKIVAYFGISETIKTKDIGSSELADLLDEMSEIAKQSYGLWFKMMGMLLMTPLFEIFDSRGFDYCEDAAIRIMNSEEDQYVNRFKTIVKGIKELESLSEMFSKRKLNYRISLQESDGRAPDGQPLRDDQRMAPIFLAMVEHANSCSVLGKQFKFLKSYMFKPDLLINPLFARFFKNGLDVYRQNFEKKSQKVEKISIHSTDMQSSLFLLSLVITAMGFEQEKECYKTESEVSKFVEFLFGIHSKKDLILSFPEEDFYINYRPRAQFQSPGFSSLPDDVKQTILIFHQMFVDFANNGIRFRRHNIGENQMEEINKNVQNLLSSEALFVLQFAHQDIKDICGRNFDILADFDSCIQEYQAS